MGWLVGGSKSQVRGVLGLSTTARNFGAALVPASNSFTDPKVTIMIIVGAIVCLGDRLRRRRLGTTPHNRVTAGVTKRGKMTCLIQVGPRSDSRQG